MKILNSLKDRLKKNIIAEDIYDEKLLKEEKIIIKSKLTEDDKKNNQEIINVPYVNFNEYLIIFEQNKSIDTIPILFWTLLLKDSSIKRSFVKKSVFILKAFSNRQYSSLAKEFRKRTLTECGFAWEKINMDYLLESYMTEDEKITVLGLASFHPNGYIREKALKELIKYNNSKIIPFIIIRACDWVYEIRKEAQNILLNIIQIENIPYIIKNIMLIDKIKENVDGLRIYYKYYDVTAKRIKDDEKFLQEIYTKLENIFNCKENQHIVSNALVEGGFSKDVYVQEYSLKKIISNDLLPYKEIIDLINKVKEPIICFRCMKLILEKMNDEEVIKFKAYLDEIDGYKAKVELIRRLYDAEFFKEVDELKSYALSKYTPVRDIARFYMRKSGFNKFGEFYIDNLDNIENKKAALLGLCETSNREEIKIIIKNFRNSSSKVQKKILNRIIELSDSEPCCDYTIFIEALESGNESIINLSRRYITQNYELFDKEIIYEAYINCDNKSRQTAMAEILCAGNGWESLMYSLKLIGDSDKTGSEIGYINIERWVDSKKSYLVKDAATGKIKHYASSKMNSEMASILKKLMKNNGHLLYGYSKTVVEGLILNYAE